MPNGGVPINLEICVGPIEAATYVLHQVAQELVILERMSASKFEFQKIGSFLISPEFLKLIVDFVLSGKSPEEIQMISSGELKLTFAAPELRVEASSGIEIASVSGQILKVLAGFMAYWVDHDGVLVSRKIPINYESTALDDRQSEWNLHWSM